MFTIHWVLELGVFLTPWACRMTQAYSPWAACSHRTEGQSHSVWNPGSRGCCGLLCLKAAAQSSFQVRLLPFSPTWLLLKGENRGFLVPKQQQSWWPQSNAPPKPELAPIFLTCLAMIYPTAFFCSAVWVWSSAVLCCATSSQTGLNSVSSFSAIPEDTIPVMAGKYTVSVQMHFSLCCQWCEFHEYWKHPKIHINKRTDLALGSL